MRAVEIIFRIIDVNNFGAIGTGNVNMGWDFNLGGVDGNFIC